MAEKRKLPARDRREPPAKRRVSEAITENSRRKKSTPSVVTHASTPAVEPEPQRQATPEPIEEPLPTKIKDGEPLPTRVTAQQSLTLSDKEYQSFAESAILSMSLERSKKKWLSDGIFERYWTKPKKTKREQLEGKNPPKDSMTKIGSCKIIIEPHHFDGMIYTIKDPNAKPTVQITPPQRHIIHYGPPGPPQPHPGYQYQHYTPPPQQMRPPPYPYNQPLNPQHAPHRPPPPQQPVPRQLPPNVQGPPPQIAKPSPDPVIQMLATRAASDPELKALMKIVASSKASQEQLRVFQGHIDELNAIIRQRERQQQQQQSHHHQQYRQPPRPDTVQNPSIPPSAPQHVAQPSPQQNIATTAPSTPAPSSSHVTPSTSTPVPVPKNPESSLSSQSTSKSQPPPEVASPASNPVQSQTQQTASSTTQSTPSAIETPTPKAAPSIKTEPGRTTPLPSAPASVVPTVNPPNSAPEPVAPMQATQSLPVPTQMSPALSPAAASTTSTPLPYNGVKASPAPNYIPHNQSPQPLSPYPPAAPQYPPYHQPYPGPPPIKARGAPPNYGPANTYYQSAPAPPPPKPPIKGVVFEFTSPLTPYGSSTSGHAGSGDRYLFPEYTILEYKAGGTVLLASFLLVRKVEPDTKFPLELAADVAPKTKSKQSKSKKKDKSKAAEPNSAESNATDSKESHDTKVATDQADNSSTKEKTLPETTGEDGAAAATGGAATTATPTTDKASTIKDEPENLKEYYQPITMRFYSSKPATLEPFARIVKPATEVRKYMEEVMDRAERAPAGFLPFRLPREENNNYAGSVDEANNSKEAPHASNASAAVRLASEDGTSRIRDGNSVVASVGDLAEGLDGAEDMEPDDLEFLLKDHYDAPNGLVPIRA